jgi:hypothetical protein
MSISEPAKLRWKKWAGRLVLLLLLALTFLARLHNRAEVFHGGGIFFTDGDCYSRMERAKMVSEGRWIIRHHDFENWPQGVTPHTTAPMDWLIVALKGVCDVCVRILPGKDVSAMRGQTLDLAGALVSPLLGVATAAWLWCWAGLLRLPHRVLMLLFFALSPILVHGTVLGRPDHQSLLIFLIAIAVGAELVLAGEGMAARFTQRWAIVAGSAWGLALWVSLYEPAIFFAGAIARHLVFHRAALTARAVRGRWFALCGIMLFALIVDGWRISPPDSTLRAHFTAWSSTIGELGHLDLTGKLVWLWFGALWILAPIGLVLAAWTDKRAWGVLLLVALMLGLTVWQLRWGYFAALALAISLPWALGALRNVRYARAAGLAAMAPFLFAWADMLRPDERMLYKHRQQQAVQEYLRNIAVAMRSPERQPFLAPWWLSPQLAYWSGQPGIAGTSHQSLAGTLDSARFFLAENDATAAKILKARGVRFVVVHDIPIDDGETHDDEDKNPRKYPAVNNAATILGVPLPAKPLGYRLAEHPKFAPPFLRQVTMEERGLVIDFGGGAANTMKLYKPQYLQFFTVQTDRL